MKNVLSRIPWFVGMPVFAGAVVIAAFVSNYLGADYFKRTRLDEANPLEVVQSPDSKAVQQGIVVLKGTLRDGEPGHRGEGTAQVIQDESGKLVLRFEAFSVTNGPDLFVVLSTDPEKYSASGALNLGALKATDGNFNYDIPAGTDISQFGSVTVWCRQFDVTFAVATFETDLLSGSPTAGQPTSSATQAAPPSATTAPNVAATPPGPIVVARGAFKDGAPGHHGSGKVTLGRDSTGNPFLVFEDFSVTNGPDLHVILGNSPDGNGEGLDLGELKATDGNFNYPLPEGTDLAQFTSVTIWCASFPTVFAVAPLEAN